MLWISGRALLPTSLSTDHSPAFWSCNTNYRPLWRHRDCKTAIKTNIYRQKKYMPAAWDDPQRAILIHIPVYVFFGRHSDIHVYVKWWPYFGHHIYLYMFFQRRRFSRRFAQPLKRHIYNVYVCETKCTLSEYRTNTCVSEGSTSLCRVKPNPYFYSLPSFFVEKCSRLCISFL